MKIGLGLGVLVNKWGTQVEEGKIEERGDGQRLEEDDEKEK
jgi:hypothetical protein